MTAIPGLTLIGNFVTPAEEQAIIQELDSRSWSTALARRTQHYGFEYDYKSKDAQKTAPPLSGSILMIAERLRDTGYMSLPTQCIVNEYTRSQGISAHTDAAIFGPVIVSVSLNAPTNMIFTRGDVTRSVLLDPGSALILTGEARTHWKHAILPRVTIDTPDGRWTKPENYRRVSLTYRTIRE